MPATQQRTRPPGRAALLASAGRGAALLLAAVALGALHLSARPSTFCTLRGLTGIPCPLCGGTTAAVRVGRGDLVGGLGASPLAVLGAAVWTLGPLRGPRPPLPARARWGLVVGIGLASWVWQLVRAGIL